MGRGKNDIEKDEKEAKILDQKQKPVDVAAGSKQSAVHDAKVRLFVKTNDHSKPSQTPQNGASESPIDTG
jgi:hypothetical protein